MSYQELPRMTDAEREQRRLDSECRGEDPRLEYEMQRAREDNERERLRRRICGRIERGEVINGEHE